MASSRTIYLVDFENVGVAGINGIGQLPTGSLVHLFSSRNCAKLSTATLASFNRLKYTFHEVSVGNQSVDKHLVSFLGFLIGRYGTTAKYVIVSADTGYDNIMKYWKATEGVNVIRKKNLSMGAITKATPKHMSTGGGAFTSARSGLKPTRPMDTPAKRTELNNKVAKLLSSAHYDNRTVVMPVASIVVKHHANKNAKQVIHTELVARFKQKEGSKIYNRIKGLL